MSRLHSYSLNVKKYIVRLLWVQDRKPKRVAWIMVLCKPLYLLFEKLRIQMTFHLFEMIWNGQKMVLERFLQLKFGEGITICNRESSKKVLVAYPAPDTRNLITYPSPSIINPISIQGGEGDFFNGFIIKVPIALKDKELQIRSEVVKRQIGPAPFKIQYI